jgi:hypothetical protein
MIIDNQSFSSSYVFAPLPSLPPCPIRQLYLFLSFSVLRVYAQTSFYQENLAFCFQLCTVTHAFRWFSAAPLVFLFLGLLPLQLYQIWRIFCVMYGEECGRTLFVWLQKLYLTEMFEWLLSYI